MYIALFRNLLICIFSPPYLCTHYSVLCRVLHTNSSPTFPDDATLMQVGKWGFRPRQAHPGSAPDRGNLPKFNSVASPVVPVVLMGLEYCRF